MPVVLRFRGYRFFFYAHEGEPREPPHIHVRKGNSEAKFWLHPIVDLSYNKGVPAADMREIAAVILQQREALERAWHDFFIA